MDIKNIYITSKSIIFQSNLTQKKFTSKPYVSQYGYIECCRKEKINVKKKSIIWVTIIFMIIVLAILIWRYFGLAITVMIGDMNAPDKNEIIELINKNQIEISDAIKNNNFENIEKIKGIEGITVEENYIDFDCGGKGVGSATSYYGFYYSEDNAINVKENIEYPKGETLQQDGKGYSWNEPDGDNRFYVEKIIDGFFYYESHY